MAYVQEITSGLEDVQNAIARLGLAGRDTLPIRKIVAEELILRRHVGFDEGRAPDGTPWPPSRRVEREGGQTLLDHGDLRSSIYPDFPGDDLELVSNDIRARVHNEGMTITPKNGEWLVFPGEDGKLVFTREVHIPQRTFLDVTDDDLEYVRQEFLGRLGQAWEG